MDNIKDLISGLAGSEDVKEKVAEVVKKLSEDSSLLEKFKADPKKAIAGLNIPDELMAKVLAGVKSVLSGKGLGDLNLGDLNLGNLDLGNLDLGDIVGKAKDLLGDKK